MERQTFDRNIESLMSIFGMNPSTETNIKRAAVLWDELKHWENEAFKGICKTMRTGDRFPNLKDFLDTYRTSGWYKNLKKSEETTVDETPATPAQVKESMAEMYKIIEEAKKKPHSGNMFASVKEVFSEARIIHV